MKNLTMFVMLLLFFNSTEAQKTPGTWGFGAEFGVMNATIDAGYFAMGFNGDYRFGENFSIAELITFIPSGDLFQSNLNTVARFNIPLSSLTLIPYLGVGFSYGNIEKEDVSDAAFSIGFPIGATLTFPLADAIAASVRTQVTIYNMDYGPFGVDKSYFELMFGFRFMP